MNGNFEINNTIYSTNEAGTYFYKEENGKKTHIKKAEYEQAWDEYMTTLNDQADADEWQAEADAELEAREQAQAENDKQAEDAFNKMNKEQNAETKKAKKPRKSKDIAYEGNGITLTTKQVNFIKMMPEDDFYEAGLDSHLWVDVFCDTVAKVFNPMTTGALVSTLNEKNIINVVQDRANGRKAKWMCFTELGQKVAKELGLN